MSQDNGKSPTAGESESKSLPLRDYLDGLVDTLRDLIPRAIGGDEDAVHDARVATRRLKAATDLLSPVLPGKLLKSFQKTLKELRRSLGALRDADVMLEHSQAWVNGERKEFRASRHPEAISWLIGKLRAQRDSALRDVATDIDVPRSLSKLGKWWALRSELAGKHSNIEGLLCESLQRQLKDFAQEADELCVKMLAKKEAAEQPNDSEPATALPKSQDPHALRISGKLLRYTLEMAAAEGWPLPPSIGKSFKQVQQALGAWHDWVVLAQQAIRLSLDAELALHDLPLQQQVLALSHAALRRAELQLMATAHLWSRRGENLQKAILHALPHHSDAGDIPRAAQAEEILSSAGDELILDGSEEPHAPAVDGLNQF